jgi:hypothetical protein
VPKAVLPTWLAATLVALTALCLHPDVAPSYGQAVRRGEQARPPSVPVSRLEIPPGEVGYCGTTPSAVYEMNRRAHARGGGEAAQARTGVLPSPASVFTQQGNFPPTQVVTCGKFRLYYEDFLQGAAGFNDASVGAARRTTLCAVLDYVEDTLALNVNPPNDYIDLYIDHSWSALNPAPTNVRYLATGGTYYASNSGYGNTPGYYDGNVMLHATTGTDPEPGVYDGVILVNFDKFYVSNPPFPLAAYPICYWDNYQNTAGSCCFDLYSVLMHEVTHALGFLSGVAEDSNLNAVSAVPGNGFTRFDDKFLYHYPTNACAGTPQKVVTGPQSSPSVNPAVSGQTNELRSNRIWLRNGPVSENHPIYSGTINPNFSPLAVGSLLSHLAGAPLSFTAMSQYAPGFQPNYVMGPYISTAQRKREWTLAELRLLLTLGYGLNPAFGAATALDMATLPQTNASLLANNSPAYRTNCGQQQLTHGGPYNFMETLPADFTITNNNTPGSVTPQLTINVAALGVADAQGDPVTVMPDTLFGIRGVSGNANDHAALALNTARDQIRYSPEPGFHGRAQFGFYLFDGHERGALRLVTVDVTPGGYVVPPGGQLVVNPGFEDGTEFRQYIQNPNIEHSPVVDWTYEGVFDGQNLSGAHPFNFLTNWWTLAGGDVMYNQGYACNWGMGPHPRNGAYGAVAANWTTFSFGNINNPVPVASPAPNERYHHFQGGHNYTTLANQVQGCNVYQFEADLNFQHTGWAAGQNFTFQLQFVNNPSPSLHTQVYYTVPVHVTVSAVAPNSWQHVTFNFQYCGAPTYFMNLLVQGILNNPPPVLTGTGSTRGLSETFQPAGYPAIFAPFIDNVSLKQVVPTPALTLSVSAQPPSGSCPPTPVTLTGLPVNYIPCNATYTWQPGNLAGNTVTVTLNTTTTYTLTVASTSCPQSASSSVTVNVPPGNNVSTGWPKHPTGRPREFFNAVGRLPNGDLVVAGTFMINEVFPGFPVFTAGAGEHQIIVYRFSETCGTVWAVTLGNPLKTETVNDLAVDAAGNIFLTGTVQQNTNFGVLGSGPGPGAYVLKLNGNTGAVLGAHVSAINNGAEGRAIALDAAGNVYVAGEFKGTLKFGTLPTLTATGWPSTQPTTDVFVARFSNALVPAWSTSFGTPANDTAGGIAFSQGGALYVAANVGGGAAAAQVPSVSAFSNLASGPSQVFVGRFNSGTGAYIANSGRMEGNAAANSTVHDMVVDGAGGGTVYFTGSFDGAFNTLANPNRDAYVASWQWQTGALVNNWVHKMGGTGADVGRALGLDGAGNLYAAGDFVGTATFPNLPSISGSTPTSANVYVLRLSVGGTPAWATASQSSNVAGSETYALALKAHPTSAFVGGYFTGMTSFGTTSLTASTDTDCYLARLSPSGLFY